MTRTQTYGLFGLILGVALLVFAIHESNTPMDQLTNALTGAYSNGTVWLFVIGVVAVLGGILVGAFGRR